MIVAHVPATVADAGGIVADGGVSLGAARRLCPWCPSLLQPRQRFCSKRCRQTAFRARKLGVAGGLQDGIELCLRYADPPYPGLSRKYYRRESTYAGEVDHATLIARLSSTSDGWALSTSARALRVLLPLCPPTVRVCVWVKANGAHPATRGPHNLWEALIVKPARLLAPVPDYLYAKPARGGGDLPGRKPIAFCVWLFRLLGAQRQDVFNDEFPGTGIVKRAWSQYVSPLEPRRSSESEKPSGQSPGLAGPCLASRSGARVFEVPILGAGPRSGRRGSL